MKVSTKLNLATFIILFVSVTLISGSAVYMVYLKGERDVQLYKKDLIEQIKVSLKSNVDIVYHHVASAYQSNQDPAKILNDIKQMRYDKGVGYFWINDMSRPIPTMIMHPTVPALDGRVLDDPKFYVASGKKENLFIASVDVCEKYGEGYVDYLWPKPTKEGLTKDQPKLSYVKAFKPLNWVVGTGVYIDDVESKVQAFREKNTESMNSLVTKILFMAVILFVLALVIVRLAFRSSMRGLERLVYVSKDLAQGEGDLSKRINIPGNDDVAELARNFNTFLEKLDAMIKSVCSTAQGTALSMEEIAAGTASLSHSSQEQAAAVEEMAATIEQMTSSIKQIAEYAHSGRDMTGVMVRLVQEGGENTQQLLKAMSEISQSANKIGDITTTVNEVAFQTNLLALNAAVEAARAGEHGKGFAVVAEEVRSLARRSAEAAKEIKGIIDETINKVTTGDGFVRKSAASQDQMIKQMNDLSQSMEDTAASSAQQAVGVDEVGRAISQIDISTQQNASTIEELTSTTQNVRDESRQLAEIVSQFKVTE